VRSSALRYRRLESETARFQSRHSGCQAVTRMPIRLNAPPVWETLDAYLEKPDSSETHFSSLFITASSQPRANQLKRAAMVAHLVMTAHYVTSDRENYTDLCTLRKS
ncbi:hypothetical protein, partial [Bradyrhizobium sp. NAS80.1]|uniref:hypothetical protein n=1 Tax=Bradyrhizobium sp. NAS80.1 TaxID=1680159 RepID=UPI001AEFC685